MLCLKGILTTTPIRRNPIRDNNINVYNSTVTSGSDSILESNTAFFGNSNEPSDYTGPGDVALSFTDSSSSDYAMKNNVYFSNSTLIGDVAFTSNWNANFDTIGHDSNGDGVADTNLGWADDSLNVDELNLTLDNGSKWVGGLLSMLRLSTQQICLMLQPIA